IYDSLERTNLILLDELQSDGDVIHLFVVTRKPMTRSHDRASTQLQNSWAFVKRSLVSRAPKPPKSFESSEFYA
ncbi:MAG TPA: hypothetical protein VLQ65_16950, partial [Saliniramus sp.]|nr:hypothetical protein [Saliniramus sp.]